MSNREAKSSPTTDTNTEMIPIYTTNNFIETEIITDIFESEDIAYLERKMEISMYPLSVGGHDQIRIAVEKTHVKQARDLIQQAIVDKAIPGDGSFLDDE